MITMTEDEQVTDVEPEVEVETNTRSAVKVHGERRTGSEDEPAAEAKIELEWHEDWNPRCPVCEKMILGNFAIKCPICPEDVIMHQYCYDGHMVMNHKEPGIVVRIKIEQKMDSAGKFSDPIGKWAVSHGQNA